MHETALCKGIVEAVKEQAAAHGFARATVVRLSIGALSHVEPEALVFAFDAAAAGTLAEGARLEIERPPGQAFCIHCEVQVNIAQRFDPCPQCGGHDLVVTGGEEMRIKELEVE